MLCDYIMGYSFWYCGVFFSMSKAKTGTAKTFQWIIQDTVCFIKWIWPKHYKTSFPLQKLSQKCDYVTLEFNGESYFQMALIIPQKKWQEPFCGRFVGE